MKFATLRDGTRDGQLVVVSRDNKRCITASSICKTLQAALDDWDAVAPALEAIYRDLNGNPSKGQPFDSKKALSPLPRAYEWVDGSAYINHIALVRKARGAELPKTLRTDPLVYQGGSGTFLAPNQDIPLADESWGLDFESEVCVVLGDIPQGTKAIDAGKYVRLVMICNDVSLRGLIPGELEKGFGFFTSKPSTAFSPITVTPDELGEAWKDGRVHLPLHTWYNGKLFGDPNAGPEMFFSFSELIQHITKTRAYTAGTILGSGTVSNEDRARGSSCLAERRMIEQIDTGKITTPFMKVGDHVAIEMFDKNGHSIFGRIDQKVSAP
ncbi:MAG: FAA hydrolase family protein [Proteobacteria bacterium]|nr:FAA hydrolase family protein [Pseudomonadota bacterium]